MNSAHCHLKGHGTLRQGECGVVGAAPSVTGVEERGEVSHDGTSPCDLPVRGRS
jgi:hypothetical protein